MQKSREDSDEEDDDLFKPAEPASTEQATTEWYALDAPDVACLPEDNAQLDQWQSLEAKESLRNRFVTGECLSSMCGILVN